MQYSKEYKEGFIKEFLDCYQKDSDLTIRKFCIEKFGKPVSLPYYWLKECDVNHIYKPFKVRKHHKKVANNTNQIVKIANYKSEVVSKSQTKISIQFGGASIEMSKDYSKEDLVLVLSALKEVNDAN